MEKVRVYDFNSKHVALLVLDPTVCNTCCLRPTAANGGFDAGCVSTILGSPKRVLHLSSPGPVQAMAKEKDPTNCSVLTVLREEGKIEAAPAAVVESHAEPALIPSRVRLVVGRTLDVLKTFLP